MNGIGLELGFGLGVRHSPIVRCIIKCNSCTSCCQINVFSKPPYLRFELCLTVLHAINSFVYLCVYV